MRPAAGALSEAAAAPRLLLLLRVGSIRFSAFYFAPFYTAIHLSGRGGPRWIGLGALFCAGLCLAVELLNRASDRREDAINNPERTRQCEAFGYRDLTLLGVGIAAALVPVGLIWFALWGNARLFAVQAAVWAVAWNYSFGLRFKARRWTSLLVLSGTFLFPFATGWATYRSLLELPAAALIIPAYLLSLVGIKDITDVEGDRSIGYRSLLLDLASRRARALALLLLAPHALIAAAVALGVMPPRFLALLAFLPFSAAFGKLVPGARTPEERRAVRELMYHAWVAIMLPGLWLLDPGPQLGAALGGTLLFWLVASRHLHWMRGPTGGQLRAAAAVLRR
ncbi:MAG TPA: UbiA family prenyltransferase [Myxococcales bacterium]|nr:UbiA family prenyltransferase [Myxococcales bacterium]